MPDRVYVTVTSDFDPTGYMQPRAITWPDGRVFRIEGIRAFRSSGNSHLMDCYTVIVCGRERRLFFERAGGLSSSCFGRWYVES